MRHYVRSHVARLPNSPLARLCFSGRKSVLLVLLLALLSASASSAGTTSSAAEPVVSHTVYLSFITLTTQTSFGLNTSSLTPERGLDGIVALGANWVRSGSLLWRDVEPVEGGGYHWDAPGVQLLEQEMLNASKHNLNLILVVRGSPTWATAPYKADCAPINAAKYARFTAFMAAAVERYSRPPYNVSYWEIGNEPDAPIFPSDSGFGCWGVVGDTYYGGRAYGALLNMVYPAIKARAPQANVLNGGLLLDHPYNLDDGSGRIARFIEGMFVAGAGASFDILSFHSYSYYDGTVDGTRGPTDWKVGYLRDLMDKYGVPRKPMINTEAALLCTQQTPDCRQAQADALGRYYIRAIGDGLLGHLWYVYDSDGFYNTALVEPSDVSVPRLAYQVYRTAAAMLGDARLLGPLAGQPAGVEGYRFARGGQTISVLWSNSQQAVLLPIQPGASVACSSGDGSTIMCDNTDGAVTLITQSGPTYVVEQIAPASNELDT